MHKRKHRMIYFKLVCILIVITTSKFNHNSKTAYKTLGFYIQNTKNISFKSFYVTKDKTKIRKYVF